VDTTDNASYPPTPFMAANSPLSPSSSVMSPPAGPLQAEAIDPELNLDFTSISFSELPELCAVPQQLPMRQTAQVMPQVQVQQI